MGAASLDDRVSWGSSDSPLLWDSVFPTSPDESHPSFWPLYSASCWEGYQLERLSWGGCLPLSQCHVEKLCSGEERRGWANEELVCVWGSCSRRAWQGWLEDSDGAQRQPRKTFPKVSIHPGTEFRITNGQTDRHSGPAGL